MERIPEGLTGRIPLTRAERGAKAERASPDTGSAGLSLRLLLLGRAVLNPQSRGEPMRFWISLLYSGLASPDEVFDAFLQSRDFRVLIAPLARLYFAILQRPPDFGGLSHWIARLQAGQSLDCVSQAFADCSEFGQRHGALGNRAFVQFAFRGTVRRQPPPEAIAYWVGRLDSGTIGRGELMRCFCGSPDFISAIAAELYVAMMYLLLLRRTPDPEGFSYFLGVKHTLGGSKALARMLGSAECRRQFEAARFADA